MSNRDAFEIRRGTRGVVRVARANSGTFAAHFFFSFAGGLLVAALFAYGARAEAAETSFDRDVNQIPLMSRDGTKISGSFQGLFGAFAVSNVDFGAGNLNTNAPRSGPFPADQRRTDRKWVELSVKPALEAETPLFGFGSVYGLTSFVAQGTRGDGDATSSLAQQGLRSTSSRNPAHIDLEDAAIGWRSGDVFKESLGENAVDISVGNQSLLLGDGLVIGSGVVNGFRRGAYYTSLASSFERTAILKLNPEGVPLRAKFFKMEDRSDQKLMLGFDQPKAKFAGFNAEWFKAAPKKEGEEEVPADTWSLGLLYFHVYDADSNPEMGFSFTPTGTASSVGTSGNRDGLNVMSVRAAGSFFEFDRDILFYGEYVRQVNGERNRQTDANGWYVEPGYRFSNLPWSPQIDLRYAHFSGQSDPNSRTKNTYDPLCFTAGPRSYGTWYLGEIYGWYLGTLSNVNVAMATLTASPSDQFQINVIFYDFHFAETRQFNDARITNDHALDEMDFYATWSPAKWFSLTGVVGLAVPGEGFKQQARAFVADNGPAGRSVGNTMALGEMIASVKF